MRKVAILQSNYLPWKGYFDLIHDVDLFLFYDDVQYTVRDWRNRNKIKTAQGIAWLTVPVGSDRNRLICEVGIRESEWQGTHWKSIQHAYSKARHFGRYSEFFRWFYLDNTWANLSELNQRLVTHISREWLGIRTEFAQASDYKAQAQKQERILELLRAANANLYVSGPAAKTYLDELRFRKEGIALTWKDYTGYPEYPQLHPPFEHAVSILDLLFHTGPEAPWYIWGWREDSEAAARH